MIGVSALALMILLAATSLAIFVTMSSSIHATRESRDFVRALKNVDKAEADATYELNAHPDLTVGASDPADPPSDVIDGWAWTKTVNDEFGILAGGTITSTGQVADTTQDRERAWRYRLIGSRSGAATSPVYGVAASSAWTGVASSVDDSTITGYVDGDWHLYGDGNLDVGHGSHLERVIAFDNLASTSGVVKPDEFHRSSLTATLDQHLVNERVTACGDDLRTFRASTNPGGAYLQAGDVSCYYSIIIDAPTQVIGTGVANIVSYGTIDIRANLTVQPGVNQLHIHTASGTVKFRGGATINAFLFAPNALCKTWDASTVGPVMFTGSLVCRQIHMKANLYQPVHLPPVETPGTAGDGIPDHSVSYLEFPGYRDRFGD